MYKTQHTTQVASGTLDAIRLAVTQHSEIAMAMLADIDSHLRSSKPAASMEVRPPSSCSYPPPSLPFPAPRTRECVARDKWGILEKLSASCKPFSTSYGLSHYRAFCMAGLDAIQALHCFLCLPSNLVYPLRLFERENRHNQEQM